MRKKWSLIGLSINMGKLIHPMNLNQKSINSMTMMVDGKFSFDQQYYQIHEGYHQIQHRSTRFNKIFAKSSEIFIESSKIFTKLVRSPQNPTKIWTSQPLLVISQCWSNMTATSEKLNPFDHHSLIIDCGFRPPPPDMIKSSTNPTLSLDTFRLRLGVYKRMEWNGIIIREWKGMKWNGMYLSKGNEWKKMEWN